jgi:hypothetical protein
MRPSVIRAAAKHLQSTMISGHKLFQYHYQSREYPTMSTGMSQVTELVIPPVHNNMWGPW